MAGGGGKAAGGGASKVGDVQICFDFTKGLCSRGDSCRFSHDLATIVTVNSQERGICFDFVRGQCNRGLLCRFSHDLSNLSSPQSSAGNGNGRHKHTPPPSSTSKPQPSSAICYDFVKGACARSDCRYSHDLTTIAGSRERGAGGATPPAPNVEICYDHTRGRCTRGSSCRYAHSVPTAPSITRSASSSSTSSGAPMAAMTTPVGSGDVRPAPPPRPPSREGSVGGATPVLHLQPQAQPGRVAAPACGIRYADILGAQTVSGNAQHQALQVPGRQQVVQVQTAQQPVQHGAWQAEQEAMQAQLEGMNLDYQHSMMSGVPQMHQGGPPGGFPSAHGNGSSGFQGECFDTSMVMGGMGLAQQSAGRASRHSGSMQPVSQQQPYFAQELEVGRGSSAGAQQAYSRARFGSGSSHYMKQQQQPALSRPANYRPPPTHPTPAWPGDRMQPPGARLNSNMGSSSPLVASLVDYKTQSQAIQNGNGMLEFVSRAPPAKVYGQQQEQRADAMPPRQHGSLGREPLAIGAHQHMLALPGMHVADRSSIQISNGQSRHVTPWGSQLGATTNMNSNMLGQLRQIWQS